MLELYGIKLAPLGGDRNPRSKLSSGMGAGSLKLSTRSPLLSLQHKEKRLFHTLEIHQAEHGAIVHPAEDIVDGDVVIDHGGAGFAAIVGQAQTRPGALGAQQPLGAPWALTWEWASDRSSPAAAAATGG